MRRSVIGFLVAISGLLGANAGSANAAGDPEAGASAFGPCMACHTLAPGRHMTGPSLDRVFGRKAGTIDGFPRYSAALKRSSIVWDDKSLDAWLANPRALVPGNTMTFQGVRSAKDRADLIAFLKAAASGNIARGEEVAREPEVPNLKKLAANHRVTAIRRCGDTYRVTTAAGELPPFWEPNLRFKTDSSERGPEKGRPAIMPGGMQGDRASVIFADPAEISAFVENRC